jgi:phospholipid/cholesterol/gamma-HCH transport system permease protein
MSTDFLSTSIIASPVGWLGRVILTRVVYLGGLTLLAFTAIRAAVRPVGDAPRLIPTMLRHATWMLGMGLPLVALVHVAIGSFLAMQAYYGGTFVDGTGAVVGVGLIRNVAPLMTGMTFAGLLAAVMTPELKGRTQVTLDPDRRWRPNRGVVVVPGVVASPSPEPSRLAAARIGAALLVAPALILWAIAVGMLVGWQVAQVMVGVSTDMFFFMFFQMLWLRDLIGLIIKGMFFGWFAAIFACFEGLRDTADPGSGSVSTSACRAACLSSAAILVFNNAWFLLFYHAGSPFGPTLMAPPAP